MSVAPCASLIYFANKSYNVDVTIRNLDDDVYRQMKARAAMEGKPIGEVVTAAMKAYVGKKR